MSSNPRKGSAANNPRSTTSRRSSTGRPYDRPAPRSSAPGSYARNDLDRYSTRRNASTMRTSDYRDFDAPYRGEKANPTRAVSNNKTNSSFLGRLWQRSKGLTIALLLIVILLIAGLLDFAINNNRIYSGISIGDVDVSGMTAEEAAIALNDRYDAGILANTAYIFPNQEDEAASDVQNDRYVSAASKEQLSLEDAQSKNTLWIENAENTGAHLAVDTMVQEALDLGKEWRFWERIGAAVGGYNIQPLMEFNSGAIETLLTSINKNVGTPMVNYGITVENGVAHVTEGHNGNLVSADSIQSDLTQAFLSDDAITSFTVSPEQVFVQIDEKAATETSNAVTGAISTGSSFVFDGTNIDIDKSELGAWVTTDVARTEKDGYYLDPSIDLGTAALRLIPKLGFSLEDASVPVTFSKDDEQQVSVELTQEEMLPNIDSSLATLDKGLFNSFRERAVKEERISDSDSASSMQSSANVFGIPIELAMQSGPFNFEEAKAFGVITEISSYTTWFYSSEATQNRDYNITRAASFINDSIIPADGGQWSWFEIAGACSEEDGFLPAGAIAADEYLQEAGGGICQVATTVFNSVYDAGYNIVERHNHTLYMSIYPDGRDAAVTYPSLDLKWQNDTSSDVLLRAWVDGASVVVSLYGVDPHYIVSTEVGEWEEGDDFDIEVKKEGDYLDLDESIIETEGVKGSSIVVKRTVTDAQGNVIYTNEFSSNYYPVTEVILVHPDTELDTAELIAEEEKRLKEEAEEEEKNA